MRFSDFKDTSIVDFLQLQGLEPAEKTHDYYKYFAPGRNEKTPSLTVYHKKNDWCDFKNKAGGDIGKLVQYLYDCDPSKALCILNEYVTKNLISPCLPNIPGPDTEPASVDSSFCIIEVKEISHWHLTNYLKSRKIPLAIAKMYLKEIHYTTAKGTLNHSLGFRNDKGGFVLRHKGQNKPHNTIPAYFTTIAVPFSKHLNLFEGAYDFLSALVYYRVSAPGHNTIVLNSLSNLHSVIPFLKTYEKINLYLDNDTAGQEAAEKIKALHPCTDDKAKFLYPSHKDFNDFLCGKKNTL